jgi:hypothetical protein
MTKIQTMQRELELQRITMESLWKDNARLKKLCEDLWQFVPFWADYDAEFIDRETYNKFEQRVKLEGIEA